jgi:beta-lactamase class A
LFSDPTTLTTAVAAEITRLHPVDVIVIGDLTVMSDSVAASAATLGPTVTRVEGSDIYTTSRAAVANSFSSSETAWLVAGAQFGDVLPAIAASGAASVPVILIDGAADTLDAQTDSLLTSWGVTNTVLVASDGLISSGVETAVAARGGTVTRLGGADSYAVSRSVNAHAFETASHAVMTSGVVLGAGAASAVFAATTGSPVFISYQWCVPAETSAEIADRLGIESLTLVGTTAVLSDDAGALEPCTDGLIGKPQSEAQLLATLKARIAKLGGRYAVSVRELGGAERRIDIIGSTLKEPASVMKLYAAYAILKRVDSGKISLATRTRSGVTVSACLRAMIHISDNLCHWDLVAMLGNVNKLNAEFYADGYVNTGYAGTLVGGRKIAIKRTTTSDVALLMSRLEAGTLLSPASTKHLLGLLETQVWRSRVPSSIPPRIEVANKPGQLWVSSGMVHGDAAIIRAPKGTYVIAILGSNNATAAEVRTISRLVYEHLDGRFGTAVSYSANNLATKARTSVYRYVGSGYVRTLPAGARVSVAYSNRDWYRIAYQGRYYWVHSSKLKNVYSYVW